jgi:hypothetical protein
MSIRASAQPTRFRVLRDMIVDGTPVPQGVYDGEISWIDLPPPPDGRRKLAEVRIKLPNLSLRIDEAFQNGEIVEVT